MSNYHTNKALITSKFLVSDLVDMHTSDSDNMALTILIDQMITKAAEIRQTLELLNQSQATLIKES